MRGRLDGKLSTVEFSALLIFRSKFHDQDQRQQNDAKNHRFC